MCATNEEFDTQFGEWLDTQSPEPSEETWVQPADYHQPKE